MAVIGAFLVLASGAGEVYRQKPRTRSLQSTGQVFLGIYLICVVSFFPLSKYPSSVRYFLFLGPLRVYSISWGSWLAKTGKRLEMRSVVVRGMKEEPNCSNSVQEAMQSVRLHLKI